MLERVGGRAAMHHCLRGDGLERVGDGLRVLTLPWPCCQVIVASVENLEKDVVQELQQLEEIGRVFRDAGSPMVVLRCSATSHAYHVWGHGSAWRGNLANTAWVNGHIVVEHRALEVVDDSALKSEYASNWGFRRDCARSSFSGELFEYSKGVAVPRSLSRQKGHV